MADAEGDADGDRDAEGVAVPGSETVRVPERVADGVFGGVIVGENVNDNVAECVACERVTEPVGERDGAGVTVCEFDPDADTDREADCDADTDDVRLKDIERVAAGVIVELRVGGGVTDAVGDGDTDSDTDDVSTRDFVPLLILDSVSVMFPDEVCTTEGVRGSDPVPVPELLRVIVTVTVPDVVRLPEAVAPVTLILTWLDSVTTAVPEAVSRGDHDADGVEDAVGGGVTVAVTVRGRLSVTISDAEGVADGLADCDVVSVSVSVPVGTRDWVTDPLAEGVSVAEPVPAEPLFVNGSVTVCVTKGESVSVGVGGGVMVFETERVADSDGDADREGVVLGVKETETVGDSVGDADGEAVTERVGDRESDGDGDDVGTGVPVSLTLTLRLSLRVELRVPEGDDEALWDGDGDRVPPLADSDTVRVSVAESDGVPPLSGPDPDNDALVGAGLVPEAEPESVGPVSVPLALTDSLVEGEGVSDADVDGECVSEVERESDPVGGGVMVSLWEPEPETVAVCSGQMAWPRQVMLPKAPLPPGQHLHRCFAMSTVTSFRVPSPNW